jgi:hypothetical protein
MSVVVSGVVHLLSLRRYSVALDKDYFAPIAKNLGCERTKPGRDAIAPVAPAFGRRRVVRTRKDSDCVGRVDAGVDGHQFVARGWFWSDPRVS